MLFINERVRRVQGIDLAPTLLSHRDMVVGPQILSVLIAATLKNNGCMVHPYIFYSLHLHHI